MKVFFIYTILKHRSRYSLRKAFGGRAGMVPRPQSGGARPRSERRFLAGESNAYFRANTYFGALGFTLLEMLVAMSVFVVVVTITTGVFTFALKSHLRVIQNQAATEDLRFALEKMARAIRVSQVVSSDGATDTLSIQHPLLGTMSYQYDVGTRAILENNSPLTSGKVRVTKLLFIVDGESDPARQPRITIVIDAESPSARPEAKTRIQLSTTISPRLFQP